MGFLRLSVPVKAVARLIGCCLLTGLIALLFFPGFMSAYHHKNNATCTRNTRDLSRAVLQYSQDWDDTFPPSTKWADAAALHIAGADKSRTFHCPEAKSPFSYAFNVHLDRLQSKFVADPATTPMIYEGDVTEFNATGDGKAIPIATRHNVDGSNIGYADGHARTSRQSTFSELNWENKKVLKNDPPSP